MADFTYFKSKNVHVYPCANRGKTEGNEIIDLESRLNTEKNMINLPGLCGGKQSYIVSPITGALHEQNELIIVLGGYYFRIYRTSDSDEIFEGLVRPLWLSIKIKEGVELANNNKTDILDNLNGTESYINGVPLDIENAVGDWEFQGLGKSGSDPGEGYISIQVTDENGNILGNSTKSIDGKRITNIVLPGLNFYNINKEEIASYTGEKELQLVSNDNSILIKKAINEDNGVSLEVNPDLFQKKLTPTGNITITENNVISSTDTKDTAGTYVPQQSYSYNFIGVPCSSESDTFVKTYCNANIWFKDDEIFISANSRNDGQLNKLINTAALYNRVQSGTNSPTTASPSKPKKGDIYIQYGEK